MQRPTATTAPAADEGSVLSIPATELAAGDQVVTTGGRLRKVEKVWRSRGGHLFAGSRARVETVQARLEGVDTPAGWDLDTKLTVIRPAATGDAETGERQCGRPFIAEDGSMPLCTRPDGHEFSTARTPSGDPVAEAHAAGAMHEEPLEYRPRMVARRELAAQPQPEQRLQDPAPAPDGRPIHTTTGLPQCQRLFRGYDNQFHACGRPDGHETHPDTPSEMHSIATRTERHMAVDLRCHARRIAAE